MRVEDRLVVADQVHLVDRQHDVADAQQRDDEAVAPRLGQHALARIDQDDRQLGGRGAGRHVAGVLLVARRVGDDELALVGREEAVGDVDGDALLALGLQAVDQQREVDARRPGVPSFLLSASSAASWSSKISLESYSSRPISVDLPSSTLPQVMKRSRSLCFLGWPGSASMSLGDAGRDWCRPSEIALLLLLLHGAGLVVVDHPALALRGAWSAASPG